MPEAFLILGSNLGDKKENLRRAIQLLDEAGRVLQVSSIYETAPWGKNSEHTYYNQALRMETTLEPFELLDAIHKIEKQLGRTREEKWGDRTLDIDIVFYEDFIVEDERLKIPHPEVANRRFVLVPLAEIAPQQRHPLFQKTVTELLVQTSDNGEVRKLLVL